MEKLQLINSNCANLEYLSILSYDGVILCSLVNEKKTSVDLSIIIASLKEIANRFADVLTGDECSSITIVSEGRQFVLHALQDEYLLVYFAAEKNEKEIEVLNRVILGIIPEINAVMNKLSDEY